MTDLATIRIPVDSSDMVNAVRDAKALESNINTLFKAFDSGAIGAGQFQKGLLQLNTKFKDLFTNSTEANSKIARFATSLVAAAKAIEQSSEMRSWFSAQRRRIALMQESERIAKRQADEEAKAAEKIAAAQEKATQAIIKQRAAAEQAATVRASNFQAGIGTNLGLGAQGISASASADAFSQEIERLRQKYDKVYSASRLYETSLNELNKAHMLGVTSIQQHEAALEQLNAEYQDFQNGTANVTNRFAQNVQQNAAGLNNIGVLIQQAGYQAGDFIVQVQSGTNAFVAFGQQATQLVGFLPMLAAEIGVAKVAFMGLSVSMSALTLGLSIFIPLVTAVGALWMRTSENSDSATESVDRQTQAYENLISKIEELQLKRQMEASGVKTQDEQIVLNNISQLKQEQIALQEKLNSLEGISGRAAGYALQRQREKEAIQAQIDQINLTIKNLDYERQLQIAATRRANEVRNQYREQFKEAEKLKQTLFQSLGTLEKMAKVNLSSVFSSASPVAQGLLSTVTDIYNKAAALAYISSNSPGGKSYLANQYSLYGQGKEMSKSTLAEGGPLYTPFPVPDTGSSGGSSGGGSSATNRVESLINQLQTEREVVEEWYAESQETLKSASETELSILGGYNEAKLRLEMEYQERLKGIRDEYNGTALGDAATFFGGMADIAKAGGDKTVKVMRVFSAAQALINSYVAFTEVLKDPSFIGRPWARFGAAASALSSGLAAVAAIKSGSSGSISGRSDRGSATVSSSSGRAPTPQTVFINSIDPESLYSGQTLINLFDAFYDENDKRGKVFVVAR